ncbi:MAG: trypsin-like peptidase domain-containing protein [Nocardioidaceae bacterium]
MTEWTPQGENDDTQPIRDGWTPEGDRVPGTPAPEPRPPESESTRHRYDEPTPDVHRDTASFGGLGFSGDPGEQPGRTDRTSGSRRPGGRPGAGVIAGLLAAALVVGGVAGVAGAAGFRLVDGPSADTASTTSTASGTTSSDVVNRKQVAPAADSVEKVASSVLPSVVKINVANSQEQGSGSGIVISSDGEILTNNHVASVAGQSGQITVSFNDGSAKKATILGTDPDTDLAVIKAEGVSGLQPATIGTSTQVAVGENVVAIGSPYGLEATVTSGIVSALNRPVSVGSQDQSQSGQATDTTYPAIQTDAAINPGNSGGPLVDLNGDVVGINSSIRTASDGSMSSSSGGSIGLGFAIPIDNIWPVVQQLRKGETPTHAKMGVSVTDASSDNGLLTGAGVQTVTQGSAAQQAGLKKGDVITKVDSQVITGSESLVATIRGHRPGDTVALTVVTQGNGSRTVSVKLDSDGGSTGS